MLRLQLLGSIDLRTDDGSPVSAVLTQPKRLGLLAFLALAGPGGTHRRDQLTPLFWPDLSNDEGRRALRQATHFLRQHLGAEVLAAAGKDEVGLNRQEVGCDAVHFEEHLARGDDAAALALYRGDLLTGFHIAGAAPALEEWLDARRRGLREAARAAARRLADRAAADGRTAEALRWAHWALDLPEADDADALRVMALFERAGDPKGGLAEYHRYARRLADEVGAEPGPAVLEASRRLAKIEPPRPAVAREAQPGPEPLPSPPAAAPASTRRRTPAAWLLLAVASVALAVAALSWRQSSSPEQLPDRRPARVVVAPFNNRSGQADLDALGPVTAEWVARGVVRIPGVEVQALGSGRDPGDALLLIRGSYYLASPDSLRYAAEVIEQATGRVLRVVDPVLAPAALPFTGVEELRDRLTSAIGAIVDPVPTPLFASAALPPRYDAWREYLRGQQAYWAGNLPEALPALLRAASLDSTYTEARVFAGVVATGLWECGVVDSLHALVDRAPQGATELEKITADISVARCRAEWPEALNLQRRRATLLPGSALAKWSVAMVARQAGRPREALGLLEEIDPARDLAWLGEAGSSLYWREITAASHALGDFRLEEKLAAAIRPPQGTPLAAAMLTARSLAGQARFAEAVKAMEPVNTLPADPALESWQAPRGMRPALLATPGWALYKVAAELAAHGAPAEARTMASRAVAWIRARAAPLSNAPEQRYVMARAQMLAGEDREARELLTVLAREDSGSVDIRGTLGVAEARMGDARAAEATIAWLRSRSHPHPVGGPLYYEAAILAAGGQLEAAARALERLPSGAHPYNALELHVDPLLAPLRGSGLLARLTRPQG